MAANLTGVIPNAVAVPQVKPVSEMTAAELQAWGNAKAKQALEAQRAAFGPPIGGLPVQAGVETYAEI
jgi:hypothetical protein